MKLRIDTYTKSLDEATKVFHDIMSTNKCDDISLHYYDHSSCYNLMASIDIKGVAYVAELFDNKIWNESPSEL